MPRAHRYNKRRRQARKRRREYHAKQRAQVKAFIARLQGKPTPKLLTLSPSAMDVMEEFWYQYEPSPDQPLVITNIVTDDHT